MGAQAAVDDALGELLCQWRLAGEAGKQDRSEELSTDLADVGVGVAVRESAFSLSVPPGQRIAVAGAAAPTYSRCVQLLAASDKGEGPYEKPPGVYHCVRTNEGRVARLRVLSSQTDFKDDFFRDVFVRVEGRVWNP